MSEYRSEYLKQWKKSRTERGLCYRCSNPVESGRKLCNTCSKKSSNQGGKWYRAKKEAKLCPACHEPNDSGYTYCDKCRAEKNELKLASDHARKNNGLCQYTTCKNRVGPESTIFCHDHYPHILELHQKKHDQVVFNGNRKLVLERDNHCCTICSGTKELEVHHLDENRLHNDMDNLTTICHSCHVTITRLLHTPAPNILKILSIVNVQVGLSSVLPFQVSTELG